MPRRWPTWPSCGMRMASRNEPRKPPSYCRSGMQTARGPNVRDS
jgi:hypothetical protein